MRNSPTGRTARSEDASARLPDFGFDSEAWLEHARRIAATTELGRIGDYVVLDIAGRGGQGTVYCCQRAGRSPVALKRIHGGVSASRAARDRLARELECTAMLAHPAISAARPVEIDGELLLEMDWIDGVPLSEWASDGEDGRRRPADELVGLFVEICAAVQHAHDRGIVHCDLKPSNILIDRQGRPHILDFGIARPLAEIGATTTLLTLTDSLVGTPAYASPEQVTGESTDIDVRSDVYSLGVLMYEAFTGVSPYPPHLSLGRLLCAIEDWEPRRPRSRNRGVSSEVEAVILRALQKDPQRRYATVGELHADLEKCRRGERPEARHPVVRAGLRRFRRQHPVAAWLLISAGILAFVIGFFFLMEWRLNQQAEAYVDQVVPIIAAHWDPEAFLSRASPVLLERCPRETMASMMRRFQATFGPMERVLQREGGAEYDIWMRNPWLAEGRWMVDVKCAKGTCAVDITILKQHGAWTIGGLIVTSSDIFTNKNEDPAPAPSAATS